MFSGVASWLNRAYLHDLFFLPSRTFLPPAAAIVVNLSIARPRPCIYWFPAEESGLLVVAAAAVECVFVLFAAAIVVIHLVISALPTTMGIKIFGSARMFPYWKAEQKERASEVCKGDLVREG